MYEFVAVEFIVHKLCAFFTLVGYGTKIHKGENVIYWYRSCYSNI